MERMTRLLVLPLNRPPNEAISAEKGLDEADDSITMMQPRGKLLSLIPQLNSIYECRRFFG